MRVRFPSPALRSVDFINDISAYCSTDCSLMSAARRNLPIPNIFPAHISIFKLSHASDFVIGISAARADPGRPGGCRRAASSSCSRRVRYRSLLLAPRSTRAAPSPARAAAAPSAAGNRLPAPIVSPWPRPAPPAGGGHLARARPSTGGAGPGGASVGRDGYRRYLLCNLLLLAAAACAQVSGSSAR